MDTNDAKVEVEKQRTKRVRHYEKIAVRISLIVATLLLIMTMLIMLAVNLA